MNNRDVNQEKKYFCDKTPLQEYLFICFSDGGNLCVTKWSHLFCFCFLNNLIQEAALKMKKMKTAELLNSAIYSNWKTVKKIHEAIIQIIYGLIMSAAS